MEPVEAVDLSGDQEHETVGYQRRIKQPSGCKIAFQRADEPVLPSHLENGAITFKELEQNINQAMTAATIFQK